MNSIPDISATLRGHLQQSGRTGQSLREAAGLSRQTFANVMGGEHDYKLSTLLALADRLGLEVRVAHYPPYCSKYNPIERRMFCHVTRACQGVLFDSVGTVKRLIEGARTEKGLCVSVGVSEKEYEVGRKYTAGFKESMKIAFDDHLPKWNYRALPSAA